MATTLLQKTSQPITYETVYTAGAGEKIRFFPVYPGYKTSIQIKKNGETCTTDITTATRDTTAVAATVGAGGRITDLELAQYANVDSGTDDYTANNDSHISCVKVTATPISSNIIITIQQHKIKP